MTQGNTVSQVINYICKECKKPFNNNGRNAQKTKEFCSGYCASKYWSRIWRARK